MDTISIINIILGCMAMAAPILVIIGVIYHIRHRRDVVPNDRGAVLIITGVVFFILVFIVFAIASFPRPAPLLR